MRKGALVLIGAVALLAAACSDGGGGSEARGSGDSSSSTSAATTGPPCEPARGEAGDTSETIESGGETRTFLLHVPEGYEGDHGVPLILNFHGFGSNAEQQVRYSRLPEATAELGAVVISPNGRGRRRAWTVLPNGPDMQFAGDLIDFAADALCIDESRVYATGISNGSALTNMLACVLADRLAAVAMVAATVPPNQCEEGATMPVLAFHGTEDQLVPYEGGQVGGGGRLAGVPVEPAEENAAAWAAQNGCDPEPELEPIEPDVQHRRWPGCEDEAAVELYTIEGGGHVWPGAISREAIEGVLGSNTDTIDATALILDFFAAHSG